MTKRRTVIQKYRDLLAAAQTERDELSKSLQFVSDQHFSAERQIMRMHDYLRVSHDHDITVSRALRDLIELRDGPQENKWDAKAVARLDAIYELAGKVPR